MWTQEGLEYAHSAILGLLFRGMRFDSGVHGPNSSLKLHEVTRVV